MPETESLPSPQDPMIRRRLEAVRGYCELQLPELAREELEPLRAALGQAPVFTEMELLILLQEERWADGHALAETLRHRAPEHPSGWLQAAYCLHELKRTQEALQLLTMAPRPLREEPLFHYNCGCYLAVLGQPREAVVAVRKAFELDASFRENARNDPDLATIRDQL